MAGISGQFYRQFALTIAASTIISAINSLTLSPALCALMLKPHAHGHGHGTPEVLPKAGIAVIGGLIAYVFLLAPSAAAVLALKAGVFFLGALVGWFVAGLINAALAKFFKGFNWFFDVSINGYGRAVSLLLRTSA
jgi:multidrug efflux pump